jgi:hypothetical protein
MEVGHFWQRILGSGKQASFIKSAEDPVFTSFTSKLIHCDPEDEQGNLQVHQLGIILTQTARANKVIDAGLAFRA